jgi:hypothetical protein
MLNASSASLGTFIALDSSGSPSNQVMYTVPAGKTFTIHQSSNINIVGSRISNGVISGTATIFLYQTSGAVPLPLPSGTIIQQTGSNSGFFFGYLK